MDFSSSQLNAMSAALLPVDRAQLAAMSRAQMASAAAAAAAPAAAAPLPPPETDEMIEARREQADSDAVGVTSKEVFAAYQPSRPTPGAAHPADVAEAASLASVSSSG